MAPLPLQDCISTTVPSHGRMSSTGQVISLSSSREGNVDSSMAMATLDTPAFNRSDRILLTLSPLARRHFSDFDFREQKYTHYLLGIRHRITLWSTDASETRRRSYCRGGQGRIKTSLMEVFASITHMPMDDMVRFPRLLRGQMD